MGAAVAKHVRMAGAVIFDMDGVLVDTEPLHLAVTRDLFGALGVEVSEAAGRALIGHAVPEILATVVRQHGLAGSLADYEARYDALLLEESSRVCGRARGRRGSCLRYAGADARSGSSRHRRPGGTPQSGAGHLPTGRTEAVDRRGGVHGGRRWARSGSKRHGPRGVNARGQ